MATPNFETLRARVQALGYEIIVSNQGEQFVIESRDRDHMIEVLFVHRNDEDDDLDTFLTDRETDREDERARMAEVPASRDDDEPTAKELLGQCWHHVHGIEQIASMLYQRDDNSEEASGAAHAISHMAAAAYELIDTAKERMGTAVTPAVIAMSKRLGKLGYKLLADATAGDIFSVIQVRPGPEITWKMFIVSLDEIDAWLEREGLEGGAS